GYSARQMVVEAPRGLRGRARALLRGLARFRLRSLLIRVPVEVWALRAYRALRRSATPVAIN
ncbi:MAG TPA: hypothetical protein VF310_15850, partial [Vicinamibacteria bacterium]